MSDESCFSLLYLSEFVAGSSIHTFGEEPDFKLERRPSAITQGCIATTLDHLVAAGIVPDHSFHGVEPIGDQNVQRDVLLYDSHVFESKHEPSTQAAGVGIKMLKRLFGGK